MVMSSSATLGQAGGGSWVLLESSLQAISLPAPQEPARR